VGSERATIVGVATGTPDGGVAVIRLSGPRAEEIGRALYGEPPAPRVLARRRLRLSAEACGVEEDALVVRMPGPGSFTGEDVVELHVHGGQRNVRSVVERLLMLGAVAADAGAFSRRAFEHGRLTLDQAEGIAALIAAQTDAALEQARRLVAGELGREVDGLIEQVHALRSEVEANLDFPDDVADGDLVRWRGEISGVVRVLESWVMRFEASRRSRERARIVLAGPPNAGKSALFNALLGRDRAIVSPLPGTTRDYVEAELRLGAHEVMLVDTAGLREARDVLEDAGIARSREQIDGADLVVWVEAADAEMLGSPTGEVVCVENKRDLGVRRPGWVGAVARVQDVEAVRAALAQWSEARGRLPWIGLARHRDRAADALAALAEAERLLAAGGPLEVVAFQLSIVEQRLAEVSGRGMLGPIGEDVLRSIFARFCIGK
jgi:tRNA modification GTPase